MNIINHNKSVLSIKIHRKYSDNINKAYFKCVYNKCRFFTLTVDSLNVMPYSTIECYRV